MRTNSDSFREFYSFLWLLYNKVQISSLLLSQLVCHSGKGNCSVKSKHANKLKHQTQALMGATRLASGHFSAASSRGKKFHLLLSIVCIFPFNYPDARRVAPIIACVFFQRVSSNLKCNKNECLHSPHSTFCANCLHSALLSTFLLIFKSLRSVDKLVIYMHYCLHSALLSAFVCTICTLVCTICTTS